MITFHDNESFDDSDSNSSGDDGVSRSSSMASEYNYVRPVEEKKSWDKFATTLEAGGSASEQHTDFIKKASVALKLITGFIIFAVVLTAGAVSKGALLFMVAQVNVNTSITHHGREVVDCTNPDEFIRHNEPETVAWLWCIFFAFCGPELLTFVKSARVYLMRKNSWAPFKYIIVVFGFETLHTIGVAILFYAVLPNLDTLRAGMVTSGILLLPSLLSIFRSTRSSSSKKKYVTLALDVLALLLQICGIIIWPVMNMAWKDDSQDDSQLPPNEITTYWVLENSWGLPLGLFLTSFGYWESFVDENQFSNRNFLWRVKINMIEEGARYTTYLFISIWKMALFLCLFLLLSTTVGTISDINILFDGTFQTSFEGTTGYFLSESKLQVGVEGNLLPLKVLATQIGCAYVAYIFGKFACKTNIQIVSFAMPITLVMPVTIAGIFGMCDVKNSDPCAFSSIPSHVWFQCPSDNEYMNWFGGFGSWIGIIWFLSSIWITRHIWMPKSQRLASTEQMFGRPYFSGLLFEQDMTLNRRSDSGDRIFRMDIKSFDGNEVKMEEPENIYEDIQTAQKKKKGVPRKISSGQYHSDRQTLTKDDKITRIKGCATMWHESTEEICEMLKSIFRMDEDVCARTLAKNILKVEDEDNYEWETHIFFDDAFEPGPDELNNPRQVNQFVRLLIKQVDIQGKKWYGGRKMKVPPAAKYTTPYGGRLVWTLPGETKIVCHVKDKEKIRHKKRWSQIMYMYYFLGFHLEGNDKLTEAQKKLRARNTYLLALDGDVDFQPEAIIKLVDLMKRNPEVGAACGRIHPTGSGYMQWYQMFEYAIGHWLQKATEHVMGCVLCSPGCFSLFRGEALMDNNVMNTYTTVPTEPKHYIQYDQGEDRWLCTLLLQQGWRVEYSAASDSFTAAPEGFKEFYNQRRRWMPSTLANIMDLLGDYKRVVKNNNDMSMFYIFYQVMMMIGTILGPGSIFIMLAGSFGAAFGIDNDTSFLINLVPLILFIIVCLVGKPDTQIMLAQLLSIVYALVMMAVLVGLLVQIGDDGATSPTALSLFFVAGSFILAGFLHPQEFICLPMGLVYYITIPSMYLFLVIYSFFNLNVVSWGTREVAEKKSAAQMAAEQADAEEDAKKKATKTKSSFLGSLFGKDSDGVNVKLSGLFNSQKSRDGELKGDLDKISNKLEQLEMAIEGKGYKIPTKQSVPEPPKKEDKPKQLVVDVPKKGVSFKMASHSREDKIKKDSYWIQAIKEEFEADGLGEGEDKKLKAKELVFWNDLIAKYLTPLTQTKKEKADAAQGLKELRDSAAFSFLMINSIWVLTIYLLQAQTDTLGLKWPIPTKDPIISFDEDLDTIRMKYEYLLVEPIGLVFVFFFATVLTIQILGMITHRLMTLGHIVSSTHIRPPKLGKGAAFDANKVIQKSGISIIKDLIQNVMTDDKDEGITMEEAVEKSLDALVKGDPNSDFHRKMSNESGWAQGKSMLKRKETMRVLQNRATEHHTRKATMKRKGSKKPNVDTIEEVPDESNSIGMEAVPEKSMPLQRTNTYKDPENLDERDV